MEALPISSGPEADDLTSQDEYVPTSPLSYLQRVNIYEEEGDSDLSLTEAKPIFLEIEDMTFLRIMGDMIMLPTGDVIIINGAQASSQGFELASQPCLNPVLYQPSGAPNLRFMTLTHTTVPRMYHSTIVLLPDGRIVVASSNPHYYYVYDESFPTELRVEAFSPEYLGPDRANLHPSITKSLDVVTYGSVFRIVVSVELPIVGIIEINMASAPFATHSFSQGQRLVKLKVSSAIPAGPSESTYTITATAPPSYYMVFAVDQGVPSVSKWVKLVNQQ